MDIKEILNNWLVSTNSLLDNAEDYSQYKETRDLALVNLMNIFNYISDKKDMDLFNETMTSFKKKILENSFEGWYLKHELHWED